MKRRSFFPSIAALFALPIHRRKPLDDGWRSVDDAPPMFLMRKYGTGRPFLRSLNMLCENVAQVFYGWAYLDEEKNRIVWYQAHDYSRCFPMSVDRWRPIVAESEKLHCQYRMVER